VAEKGLGPELSREDLARVARLLAPQGAAPERLVEALAQDPDLLDAALAHPAVQREVLGAPDDPAPAWETASLDLYFAVLLRRAQQDLAEVVSIPEWTDRQQVVPLLDAGTARQALDRPEVRRYLGRLLASFARVRGASPRHDLRHRRGRRPGSFRPFHDLDLASLLQVVRLLPSGAQPALLHRGADLALFLAGVFPRQVVAEAGEEGLSGWERQGQGLYHAAAVGYEEVAPRTAATLDGLAEHFHPSRRALNFVAQRYLRAS
jgi:hypothetical protein